MAEIDYYLFPLSPFSYLAGLRLEEIAARHGARDRLQAGAALPHLRRDRHAAGQGPPRLAAELPAAGHRPGGAGGGPAGQPRSRAHWPTNPVPASRGDHRGAGGGRRRPRRAGARLPARGLGRGPRHRRGRGGARRAWPRAGFDPALADRGLLDGGRDAGAQHRRGAAPHGVRRAELRGRRARCSGARTGCRCSTPISRRSAEPAL